MTAKEWVRLRTRWRRVLVGACLREGGGIGERAGEENRKKEEREETGCDWIGKYTGG